MADRELICCFTGHREIAAEHANTLLETLDEVIAELVKEGISVFRAGGAIGFDMLAALKVINAQKTYPHIRLELYLPCRDQADRWSESDRHAYQFVCYRADSITYTSENYFKGCMQLRDRKMVDGSDVCVAYCMHDSGGTAYTLRYAQKNGLRCINIVSRCKR